MIARNIIRKIGIKFKAEAAGRDPDALISITARDAEAVGEILTNPPWFTAKELRIVADAMDILNYAQADGWTMRERLDEFGIKERNDEMTIVTAGAFAAFLNRRYSK